MLTFLLLSICIGIAVYMFLRREKDDPRLPPGPKGLPFFGSVLSLDTHIHFTYAKWAKQYGDIFTYKGFPGRRAVVISSADMIRETMTKPNDVIMSNRIPTFGGHYLFSEDRDVIFSQNQTADPNYIPRRKAINRLIKLYGEGGLENEGSIVQEMQSALVRYEETAGKPFVPHDIVAETVWDIIAKLLIGDYYKRDEKLTAAAWAYNGAALDLFITPIEFFLGYMPWLRHIPGLKGRTILRDGERAIEYLENHFENVMRQHDPEDKTKAVGLLHSLLEAEKDVNEKGKFKFNKTEVSGIIRDLIVAGLSSTTYSTNIMMRIFLNYPDVQKKVQEEIDTILGDRPPNLKDRYDMPYTQATILELTRYAPLLPYNVPHSPTEDVMFHGYLIPKGCGIFHNQYSALRDERVFKNAKTFDPTRFLEEDGSLVPATHRIRMMTMPFGIGTRQCAGEVFAKSRLFLFVTQLMQKFTLVPADPNDIPSCQYEDFGPGFVLQVSKFPLRMLLRSR